MSFLPSRCAVLLTGLLMIGPGAAAGSAGFPPPPPPPLGVAETGFDEPRKPPIPVSFLTHEGGWVGWNYPPSARDRVASLMAQADDWRGELAEALGQPPLDGVEVRIARGPEEMATLAPAGVAVNAGTAGAAYPKLKLIVLSLGTTAPAGGRELASAFRRELARMAIDEAARGRSLPSWFTEGFAAQFAGDGGFRAWTLYPAAVRHRTLAMATLRVEPDVSGPQADLALAEAADFMRFLARPEQHARMAATLGLLGQGQPYDAALLGGYGAPLSQLEQSWRADLQRRAITASALLAIGLPAAIALSWLAVRALGRWRARARSTRRTESRARTRPAEAAGDARRVHIVFSRREDRAGPLPALPEAEIPKVEHEGEWHTLH